MSGKGIISNRMWIRMIIVAASRWVKRKTTILIIRYKAKKKRVVTKILVKSKVILT
jgi:hypothetical protein